MSVETGALRTVALALDPVRPLLVAADGEGVVRVCSFGGVHPPTLVNRFHLTGKGEWLPWPALACPQLPALSAAATTTSTTTTPLALLAPPHPQPALVPAPPFTHQVCCAQQRCLTPPALGAP